MLTNQQKASIHIAKNERGMSDSDYRALLKELTGAVSSTDPRLGDKDYQAIMKAVNGVNVAFEVKKDKKGGCNARRIGWKDSQLQKFRQYARFCRMDINEARTLLYQTTGAMNEESPALKQIDFDDFMATIEARLEALVIAGATRVPDYISLQYWRQRYPKKGGVNSRESHKIYELWEQLSPYLNTEKQNLQYLFGFAAHTCNLSRAKAIEDLTAREALKVIDALKKRLIQEQSRHVDIDVKKDEVPF
jgi:phage gp16-like protein